MNLVYADEQGNVFDHPEWIGLGRSGDMVVELMEDELIPLPEGATLVGLAIYASNRYSCGIR